MTRKQYFKILENNIQSLSIDEQKEALNYYSDYFDEACDDKKVMEELGSPEELAKSICEKFANALVAKNFKTQDENCNDKNDYQKNYNNNSEDFYDALYFEFDCSKIKNLELNFGAAEIVLIQNKKSSNKICVETRGILNKFLVCKIFEDGIFSVKNKKRYNQFKFWDHNRTSRIIPRILISVPLNFGVERIKIKLGAGKLICKDVMIFYKKALFDLGGGIMVLKNFFGHDATIRCAAGNFEYFGNADGKVNIDCAMANVKMNLEQDFDSSSYDAKVGLGKFQLGDLKKEGLGEIHFGGRRENHFSANIGMGNVFISSVSEN